MESSLMTKNFTGTKRNSSAANNLVVATSKRRASQPETGPDLEMIAMTSNNRRRQTTSSLSPSTSTTMTTTRSSQTHTIMSHQNNNNIISVDPFNSAAQQITKMLVLLNFISLTANFTIACVYITRFILDINNAISTLLMILANLFLVLSHSTNIFLYYKYDKLFYNRLNSLFKWKF